MKETIQLELTNPCHESWNAMTANEQGRYCQSCCKTVVDFTAMTDREIVDYISHFSAGDTCARVQDNQLNRLIQTPPERKHSWKYFWSLALSSLLISYRSVAQVKPLKGDPVAITSVDCRKQKGEVTIRIGQITTSSIKDTITSTMTGRVVNEQGIPVPFASITLTNPTRVFIADEEGNYSFSIRSEQVNFTGLTISAVGYEPVSIEQVQASAIQSLEVIKKTVKMSMKDVVMKQRVLKEVVVQGYASKHLQGWVGGLTVSRKCTTYQKVKQTVKQTAAALIAPGRSDLAIYPNPAPANGTFTLKFNIKQPGEYNVQFIDVAGRIVGGRQVMIASAGQTETFMGSQLPGHGAYFIRVAGRQDGKIYNTKLLVQ